MNASRTAIQILSIVSGALATFFIPYLYGLEDYGVFLRLAILSFIVHRFIDVMNEPLILMAKKESLFLAVITNGVAFSLVVLLFASLFNLSGLDISLLLSLVVSSAYLNYLYKITDEKALLFYYIGYISLFFGMSFSKFVGIYSPSISQLYQVVAYASILISIFLFGNPGCDFPRIHTIDIFNGFKRTIFLLGFAFSNMFFSYLFLYLMMAKMDDVEIGGLRVMLALVQSAILLYPINMKFIQIDLSNEGIRVFTHHHLFSSVLFLGGGVGGLFLMSLDIDVINKLFKQLPYDSLRLLISITPIMFFSYLLERYHSARGTLKHILFSVFICYVPFFSLLYFRPEIISSNVGLVLMILLSCYTCTLALFSERKVIYYAFINTMVLNLFYYSGRFELYLSLFVLYVFMILKGRSKL
nr:hypothetical protein [Plesiomonas shigelloides]